MAWASRLIVVFVWSRIVTTDTNNPYPSTGFDAVIGNPPFLNQLSSTTATNRGIAALLKAKSGGATSAFTDIAAVFLHDAINMTARNGRTSLLLPQSILASRDCRQIRTDAAESCTLEHLWISGEHAFADALVATVAPVLCKQAAESWELSCSHSLGFDELATTTLHKNELVQSETWSHLTAKARGVPQFEYHHTHCIQSMATATADFRDEYYGLDGFLLESSDIQGNGHEQDRYPPIVTSGLLDPAVCYWSKRTAQILKHKWTAPCVDRSRMEREGPLAAWIDQRLIPKIMLATQSRVTEVYVDERGRFLPCMPVISVRPESMDSIWHIASAIGSPVVSAIALERYSGAAMTTDTIKLAARQVLRLPVPVPSKEWDAGARAFKEANSTDDPTRRRELVIDSGSFMCDAFKLAGSSKRLVMNWWTDRF